MAATSFDGIESFREVIASLGPTEQENRGSQICHYMDRMLRSIPTGVSCTPAKCDFSKFDLSFDLSGTIQLKSPAKHAYEAGYQFSFVTITREVGGCIKKKLSWLAATAIVLACITQCSRGKPDFTGTWVQAGGPPTPGALDDPDLEPRMMIKQDGATMSESVTVVSKSKPSRKSTTEATTFKLDKNEQRSNPSTVSKTYWEKNTLIFKNTEFRENKIVSTHTIV